MKPCSASARRVATSWVPILAVGLVVVAWPAHAAGDTIVEEAWAQAATANAAMESWNYPLAEAVITRLEQAHPDDVATLFVRGKFAFHAGDYDAAYAALQQAVTIAPSIDAVRSLHALVADTREVVRDYATHTTADGLFEIRYDASRDAVLIPWAEETLEAAYYEIGYDLGYWPTPPIRVEIYPRAATLARVSSLTEEAIETSGTIALCKYNKLMFTSPRATLRGYAWRDTLSHEYVHYLIGHRVRADLPIWFHEAVAKYLEARWTGRRAMRMDPSREELLTERIAADALITFEQMHPSMAYLPSPDDAATAYAQVFTVVEYLIARRGPGVLRRLLERVADGADIVAAFEGELGEPFTTFERNWLRTLRERPPVTIPGTFREEMQLRERARPEGSGEALPTAADEFMRLGELLRARGLLAAAVAEYEKAELLLGRANPMLQNALAAAQLDLDAPARALEALEDVVHWHPSYYVSHLNRGAALNALGDAAGAAAALELAGGINPFDPEVHRQLAIAYDALDRAPLADRHRQYAATLHGDR